MVSSRVRQRVKDTAHQNNQADGLSESPQQKTAYGKGKGFQPDFNGADGGGFATKT